MWHTYCFKSVFMSLEKTYLIEFLIYKPCLCDYTCYNGNSSLLIFPNLHDPCTHVCYVHTGGRCCSSLCRHVEYGCYLPMRTNIQCMSYLTIILTSRFFRCLTCLSNFFFPFEVQVFYSQILLSPMC